MSEFRDDTENKIFEPNSTGVDADYSEFKITDAEFVEIEKRDTIEGPKA